MNKQQFIEGLRRSLSSINDYAFVNDTISYYENYIDTQIRMGKTEAEVMKQLGDPRLIAKSIRATHVTEGQGDGTSYNEFGQQSYGDSSRSSESGFHIKGKRIKIPALLVKILVALLVFVVLFVVFTVLKWLSPFIFMGVVAYLIHKFLVGKY